ncbi:hypothetical protein, partial [Rhodococcus opacus]|uniref:hypothetical protein n=1 Tax=Rhodococcus opacus TaxID=37919 RepID=UPI001C470004
PFGVLAPGCARSAEGCAASRTRVFGRVVRAARLPVNHAVLLASCGFEQCRLPVVIDSATAEMRTVRRTLIRRRTVCVS